MTRKGRYWGRGGALKPGLEHIRDIGEMGGDIEHTEEIKADIEDIELKDIGRCQTWTVLSPNVQYRVSFSN